MPAMCSPPIIFCFQLCLDTAAESHQPTDLAYGLVIDGMVSTDQTALKRNSLVKCLKERQLTIWLISGVLRTC